MASRAARWGWIRLGSAGLLGVVCALVTVGLASCNALTGASDIAITTGAPGGSPMASGGSGGSPSGTGGVGAVGGAGGAEEQADGGPGDGAVDAPLDTGPDALDPTGDEDQDGVINSADNCPLDFNPCQYDRDDDDTGDVCDSTCEEHCSVRTCDWPDAQGCNCGGCPSGYRCVWDSHYDNGRSGDVDLPDGGTYHCTSEWYKVCAKTCSSSEPCAMGTCLQLTSGGCICFSFAMLGPCES